jgi:peptide deformylase
VVDRILRYPDPLLRRKAEPVEKVTPEIRDRALAMFDLMHEENGIGLSATQVGWNSRIIVLNLTGQKEDDLVLVNPVAAELSKSTWVEEEGCLSLPGISGKVERPKEFKVLAASLTGEILAFGAKGMLGRCILHELDHLEGVLLIDRLSQAKKLTIKKKLQQLEDLYAGR